MTRRVIIVGAGHAGGSAAVFLRQNGFKGEICLVGEEPMPPYQRPPLSKAWLKGDVDTDDLMLRPAKFYAEQDIALRIGQRAVSIDRNIRRIELESGETLPYDVLILATGARPRPLPVVGAELHGVLALRTVVDADALRVATNKGGHIAIIGGGYVGLEIAASARALGISVVVIEREARCLARVASEPLSAFFENYHRAQGVSFAVSTEVAQLEGVEGRLTGIRLSDNRLLPCNVAVVGIGAIANTDLARDAGLRCISGVEVDEHARTVDPHIYAIGDVSYRPVPFYGRMCRLESIPNALEQARQAATHICGRDPPLPELPWFWSDQYDLKLQIAGLPFDADSVIVRGDVDAAKFAIFHLRGDDIVCVEAVNAPQEFLIGRTLIGTARAVSRQKLADPLISMRAVTMEAVEAGSVYSSQYLKPPNVSLKESMAVPR